MRAPAIHEFGSRFRDECALVTAGVPQYRRRMDKLHADVIHAWRSLRSRPAYFFTCAATLTLVLGANAAIFSVVNATLLRPLPFKSGERTVHLFMLPPGLTDVAQRNPLQQMDVLRFRDRTHTLARLEGFLLNDRVVIDRSEPNVVKTAAVTPGLLSMVPMRLEWGRHFLPEEEQPGHSVAIVTMGYWRQALGGADLNAARIVIDGIPHAIVGLTSMPPAAFLDAQVFTPLSLDRTPAGRNPGRSVVALGELADGVTVAQANQEAAEIFRQIAAELPQTHNGWTGGAESARQFQFGAVRAPVLVLFAATGFVLLIACANIASLTSAQAAGRSGEVALRVALGASRADVIRLQVLELVLISCAAAVPGLVLARLAVPSLLAMDPAAARTLGTVALDWRVQVFTAVAALVTALSAGLAPAMHAFKSNTSSTLSEGSRRSAGGRTARRMRGALVAGEVGVCVALLMGGAALVQGLLQVSRLEPGFDPHGVLAAQVRLQEPGYAKPDAREAVVSRILETLRALPGVEAASTVMNRFEPGFSYQTTFVVPNRPRSDGQPWATQFRRVSSDYFRTMRIREMRGRTFSESDTAATPHVAVISQLLADQLFPGEDPVGRVIRRTAANAPPTTIVGVVDDVRDVSMTQAPEPTLYLSWAQNSNTGIPVSFVVRTAGDPASLTAQVRAAVANADPELPLQTVLPLETFLQDSLAPPRFRSTVLAVIAALGLILAALGIYGVTSRGVVDRRHEFAVRLALGATSRRLVGNAVGDSLRNVAVGAIGGIVGGAWLCATLSRLLENVPAGGAVSTALMATVLLSAAAAAAALIPAVRVLRVQPADALKV
jgi:putative ABC transport system permease protein